MSATVGVTPVSRLGQLADQHARTSVSELFDAVNTSGQCRPVRRVVMVLTDVLTNTNISEQRDDGGHLRFTDRDVTTVHVAMNTSGQR